MPRGLIQAYFSDVFDIDPETLRTYGAFNVSLVTDLPLFIDPFLLFFSEKEEYKQLHSDIIRYVIFLRDRAVSGPLSRGEVRRWFMFPEIRHTWFGFSRVGNRGHGLGAKFARELRNNLALAFPSQEQQISESKHLEKVCLITDGVGKDNISDFATNLIQTFLLEFTQKFALEHLDPAHLRRVRVGKVEFNYSAGTWLSRVYTLPYVGGEHVILTPIDMLTKDENWINRSDLITDFPEIASAIPNDALRSGVSDYFATELAKEMAKSARTRPRAVGARSSRRRRAPASPPVPTRKQKRAAVDTTIQRYPVILDYYIQYKEVRGAIAEVQANERVRASEQLFVGNVMDLAMKLLSDTAFYSIAGNTLEEARARVQALKAVVEGGLGGRLFSDGKPLRYEADLHAIVRLVWRAKVAARNENDYSLYPSLAQLASESSTFDRAVVKFSLASSPALRKLLSERAAQLDDGTEDVHTVAPVVAVIYYTAAEQQKLRDLIDEAGLQRDKNIVAIRAAQ